MAVILLTSYSHLSEPTVLLELAPYSLRYRLPGIIGPVPPPLLIREIQYLVGLRYGYYKTNLYVCQHRVLMNSVLYN